MTWIRLVLMYFFVVAHKAACTISVPQQYAQLDNGGCYGSSHQTLLSWQYRVLMHCPWQFSLDESSLFSAENSYIRLFQKKPQSPSVSTTSQTCSLSSCASLCSFICSQCWFNFSFLCLFPFYVYNTYSVSVYVFCARNCSVNRV